MPELTSSEHFDLWMRFLQRWPIDKLKNMTLAEYNSLGSKDSFCFWLENLTRPLGSIRGGSSFKFGIFEFDPKSENANKDIAGVLRDEKYKWSPKYGGSADAAFEKIRSIIVSIADASSAGDHRHQEPDGEERYPEGHELRGRRDRKRTKRTDRRSPEVTCEFYNNIN